MPGQAAQVSCSEVDERVNGTHILLPAALVDDEVDQLRPHLFDHIRAARTPVVVLDAHAVELISSSGLGLLAAAALLARESGGRLEIHRPSELFQQSIALTGLAPHLGVIGGRELVGQAG